MCCKNHSQFPSLPTSLEKLTAVQAAVVQYIAQAMHSHTLQYASSQHLPCTFWSYSWVHLKVFFCVLRPYSYHFPTAHLDLDCGGSPDFLHVSHLLLIWDGKKFFPKQARDNLFSESWLCPRPPPGMTCPKCLSNEMPRPGGILFRCLSHLNWILLMWRGSSSTPSPSRITELLTL